MYTRIIYYHWLKFWVFQSNNFDIHLKKEEQMPVATIDQQTVSDLDVEAAVSELSGELDNLFGQTMVVWSHAWSEFNIKIYEAFHVFTGSYLSVSGEIRRFGFLACFSWAFLHSCSNFGQI